MKNDQVMANAHLMFISPSGIWPILCQLMTILAKLLDMDFKFVLPNIYINFDIQTNFEVNQTKLAILSPKILKKSLEWPFFDFGLKFFRRPKSKIDTWAKWGFEIWPF